MLLFSAVSVKYLTCAQPQWGGSQHTRINTRAHVAATGVEWRHRTSLSKLGSNARMEATFPQR
jgi:hypothetical protein